MKPNLISYNNVSGTEYRFDIFISDDFSGLKNICQVYGMVLNDKKEKILVVYNHKSGWILPGGTVEEGEDIEDTLKREVKEETNRGIDVSTITPFFYQKAYKKIQNKWIFESTQVRYLVIASDDCKFISDPDEGDITEVKWIDIKDLGRTLRWGITSDFIDENISGYIDRIN